MVLLVHRLQVVNSVASLLDLALAFEELVIGEEFVWLFMVEKCVVEQATVIDGELLIVRIFTSPDFVIRVAWTLVTILKMLLNAEKFLAQESASLHTPSVNMVVL